MKRCPYCQADSFGVREPVLLDYFHSDECAECGERVRNDGLRQFLVLPAIIVALAVGFLIFAVVPDVLEPFAFLIICLLLFVPWILLAKPVKAQYDVACLQFDADDENDKLVMVGGWKEDELRQILDGFIAETASGFPPYRVGLEKQYEDHFRLSFPDDIHPALFASLVNYLVYPIEFGTAHRLLVVAGQTTLNSAFDGIPKTIFGHKAVLYVPENDEEHDVVYLRTESGMNFANSLNGKNWHQVEKPRMSAEIKRLGLNF